MFLMFLQAHFLPTHMPREFSQSLKRWDDKQRNLSPSPPPSQTWSCLQSLSAFAHQGFSQNPWVQSQDLLVLHNFFPVNIMIMAMTMPTMMTMATMSMTMTMTTMTMILLMQSLKLEHSSVFLSNWQMLDSHLKMIIICYKMWHQVTSDEGDMWLCKVEVARTVFCSFSCQLFI